MDLNDADIVSNLILWRQSLQPEGGYNHMGEGIFKLCGWYWNESELFSVYDCNLDIKKTLPI